MSSKLRHAAGLAAVAALALPAAAAAHPGVYTVTQKVAPAGVVYPNAGGLTDRIQYAVANDGYALGFTETTGSGTQFGMINYKVLPGTYRANMTSNEKRIYADAQTNLQAHATCEGVANLDPTTMAGGANVLAWQEADPFFNYIPWQKTGVTVGADTNQMGEDPAHWIPVVKAATVGLSGAPAGGVDLAALSTVQQFTDACTALGGTYRVADAPAAVAGAMIADAVGPFQTQVTSLTTQVTTLTGERDTLAAGKKTAEDAAAAAATARQTAEQRANAAETTLATLRNRPLTLTLTARRFSNALSGMVTGPSRGVVTLTLRVDAEEAEHLGLKSEVLSRATRRLSPQGALLISIAPGRAVRLHGDPVAATLVVEHGDQTRTATVTFTN